MRLRNLLKDDDNSAVKAAMYYMICQILVKGMTFITTPIFSRILTKADYGAVSNFVAWEGLIFPIVTLNLRASINKSKYDYSDDNDNFLSSILIAALALIAVSMIVVEFNSDLFVSFFSMPMKHIRMLFLYLAFMTAFDFQQIQYNIYRKYKIYVVYSLGSVFLNLFLSVILVLTLPDKLIGRLTGIVVPCVLIGIIIYINAFRRGNHPQIKYMKNALFMTVPLLLSALSSNILNTSDKVMITKFSGNEDNAMYSIAYSVAGLAAVVFTALNQAWAPWMFDHMKSEDFGAIKKRAKQFSGIYSVLIIGLMLISPEIIMIMGGKQYYGARFVMPPVVLAMVCQYFYAFYFDTEYFYGETYIISLGTFIAAVLNLGLNFVFIPRYGYIAAAYTTLAGYAVMMIYHYCIVRFKLKKDFVFPTKWYLMIIILLAVIQIGIIQIYEARLIRYSLLAIYGVGVCWISVKMKLPQAIIAKFKK